jgi:hypothetical protein
MRVLSSIETRQVSGAMMAGSGEEIAVEIPKAISTLTQYLKSNPVAVTGAVFSEAGATGVIASIATYGGTLAAVGTASYSGMTWLNEYTNHWFSDKLELGLEYVFGDPSLPQADVVSGLLTTQVVQNTYFRDTGTAVTTISGITDDYSIPSLEISDFSVPASDWIGWGFYP